MQPRLCDEEDCERTHYAKGMCRLHYDRQYSKKYREANPERVRATVRKANKKWREENLDKCRDMTRKSVKKWKTANPKKAKDQYRKWYEANKDLVLENNRKWRAANPERAKAQGSRKRARRAQVQVEPYDRKEVYETDGFICKLCEESIDMRLKWPDAGCVSIDHILPISLGGDDIRSNVQSAHLGCNARKGNRIPTKAE